MVSCALRTTPHNATRIKIPYPLSLPFTFWNTPISMACNPFFVPSTPCMRINPPSVSIPLPFCNEKSDLGKIKKFANFYLFLYCLLLFLLAALALRVRSMRYRKFWVSGLTYHNPWSPWTGQGGCLFTPWFTRHFTPLYSE